MKKFVIFFVSLYFCLTLFGKQEDLGESVFNSVYERDSVFCTLKILKITNVDKAYIIDASDIKNNYLYKIVSIKEKTRKCNKIKIGKEFKFVLFPYYNIGEEIPNENIKMVVEINGVTLTVQSDSWSSNVYTTPNLIGLFYVDYP